MYKSKVEARKMRVIMGAIMSVFILVIVFVVLWLLGLLFGWGR
jgi:predicted nucleic acid-binding Zn ribbon protein